MLHWLRPFFLCCQQSFYVDFNGARAGHIGISFFQHFLYLIFRKTEININFSSSLLFLFFFHVYKVLNKNESGLRECNTLGAFIMVNIFLRCSALRYIIKDSLQNFIILPLRQARFHFLQLDDGKHWQKYWRIIQQKYEVIYTVQTELTKI